MAYNGTSSKYMVVKRNSLVLDYQMHNVQKYYKFHLEKYVIRVRIFQ